MPLQRKMSGARLGIVGMGRIGQAIASRAAAFGMQIAYTARSARHGLPHRYVADVETFTAETLCHNRDLTPVRCEEAAGLVFITMNNDAPPGQDLQNVEGMKAWVLETAAEWRWLFSAANMAPVAGEAALAKLRREADERARELRRLKGAARA
jgi:hypothetical protein